MLINTSASHRADGGRPARSAWRRASVTAALGLALLGCGDSAGPDEPAGPPLSHLALFPDQTVALVGEEITFEVTARDLAGVDLSQVVPAYSSSNNGVVRVETDGRIVARGAGSATVRASAGGKSADAVIHVGAASYDLATLGPPRVLDANYIDLDKIERISRFRSTIGHSYTDGSETCRSMKHYYQPYFATDWRSVDVYAPASGAIVGISPDGFAGHRVRLRPRDLPILDIQIFHVSLDSGIVRNMWINAGDHIGRHASMATMSDIAMSIGPKEGGKLISYFDAMTDAVFAEYAARGVPSRAAAIITAAERDADPVPCVGEQQFTVRGTLPDWLVLN